MTPRPCINRRVRFNPNVDYFKPAGIPMMNLKEVQLTPGEAEAIRLFDVQNLEQKRCAEKMEVSQPTFSRILDSARKKVADALINGKAIRIEKKD